MAQYIQNPDGKMAGSIGDGRDNVPSVATELRSLASQVEEGMTPKSLKAALTNLVNTHSFRTETVITGTALHLTPAQQDEMNDLTTNPFITIYQVEQRANGDVVVIHDYEPGKYDNPRIEHENVSRFVGDPTYLPDEDNLLGAEDLSMQIRRVYGEETRMVPIYVTDHGSYSFTTGTPVRPGEPVPSGAEFGDRWDTSLSGFAIVGEDVVKAQFGDLSDDSWERAINQAKEEVAFYGQWVNGDMYGLTVINADGYTDTTGGYYEKEHCILDSGWTPGECYNPSVEAA